MTEKVKGEMENLKATGGTESLSHLVKSGTPSPVFTSTIQQPFSVHGGKKREKGGSRYRWG